MAFKGNFVRAPYKRPGILKKGWVISLRCYPPPEEYAELRKYLSWEQVPQARWLNEKIHEQVMEYRKHYADMNEKDPPLAVE